MKNKPILIVAGEPNSIFLEIFFKSISTKKFKSPLVLICSLKLLKLQMKKLNFKKEIHLIKFKELKSKSLNNKMINIIDVEFIQKKAFEKITKKSNKYINKCFNYAFKIIRVGISNKLINGPISKKNFLNKKFLGVTEFISNKFSCKKNAMLIYNKNLSVCPLTTHLPLKTVPKKINKKMIEEKIILIIKFYKKILGINPKIGVLGLNPHCESISKYNEDEKIIAPVINKLKKLKIRISGPYPADTSFLKKIEKNLTLYLVCITTRY